MADLVPVGAGGSPPPSLLAPLTDPAGGSLPARMGLFLRQPPMRRALPWFGGITAAGLTGLLWLTMAPAPQRMLYSDLSDAERAQVTAALDKAAIAYRIDNSTGAITVGENDLYKARMVAASDGAVATPETGEQMIDKLPMGASRTLEGQRLQAARERELELTIMQIDGVEAVRVHLAQPEKSVFVRDTAAPSASVMVRLSKGRQLGSSQVSAIINLVAAWFIGTRNMLKALLKATLEPSAMLRERESAAAYTDRLALQEEFKALPWGAVWDYYCTSAGLPKRASWLAEIKQYESDVLSARA